MDYASVQPLISLNTFVIGSLVVLILIHLIATITVRISDKKANKNTHADWIDQHEQSKSYKNYNENYNRKAN